MNKRVQSKHGSKAGKGGGSSWAKSYALRSQEKQLSIDTLLQQNRESFNAWCILAGKKGVPDLLVGFRGVNFLIEVKSHSKAKLTPDQVVFFGTWCGQVSVVYSVEEAISLVTSGKKDML